MARWSNVGRVWRWQQMLDDGVYASVNEIGNAENLSKNYVSRILKRALLAPDLVEGMVAGTADQALVLVGLERPCRWIGVSSAHLFRHASVVGGFFRLISLNQTFAWRGPYRRIGV